MVVGHSISLRPSARSQALRSRRPPDTQSSRISRYGSRVRRACRTDARFLYQRTTDQNFADVAAHGRSLREVLAVGRLSWWPRHSTSLNLVHASHCRQLASNSAFAISSVATGRLGWSVMAQNKTKIE